MLAFFPRELPDKIKPLTELALDLRWTWSHASDALWRSLAPHMWERTKNPWVVLQDVEQDRLDQLASDAVFTTELDRVTREREGYLSASSCFPDLPGNPASGRIAYFSMEFGLGEGLPLYAGGLGILAGDYLKSASDLGLPLVGVGLLYQEGYFRQRIGEAGQQLEMYPYNAPSSLPIQPVASTGGGWLHVSLEFPGRDVLLRVWEARVGRVRLYLLDSNDPINAPADRGITSKLYGGGPEARLMQEIVLGIGGWRLLDALGLNIEICHLNEGHAAFVVLERARHFMSMHKLTFWEALWATRAGNVFTTHTPVAAGFDRFALPLLHKYLPYFQAFVDQLGISMREVLGLGRSVAQNSDDEPFNMAYLAMRGCSRVNAVSQLHGEVSRRIFSEIYPRWPIAEIPVTHVTNGVHVPSWDSPWSDRLWSQACGKSRWLGRADELTAAIEGLDDAQLWSLCGEERHDLIRYARLRLAKQLGQGGLSGQSAEHAQRCFDPNILTLGFARRFAEYKRPNLLLTDRARLIRMLTDPHRPVQLIVAGKAHPDDGIGKQLIHEWIDFIKDPAVQQRVVFLEDYDITLAQELVQGVDVWINTPRRPWEACGTSGMKVLVNGGLNLSSLDGWWAEAYSPDVGWALGDGREPTDRSGDIADAHSLYHVLETQVIPLFYERDAQGVPREWVSRIRKSMAQLAPRFSGNRMLNDYIDTLYRPAIEAVRKRSADGAQLAKSLYAWEQKLHQYWRDVRFGPLKTNQHERLFQIEVHVYLGDLLPQDVRVELYADACDTDAASVHIMNPASSIPGAINGYVYETSVATDRPPSHFTPRIVPGHAQALQPIEISLIQWR